MDFCIKDKDVEPTNDNPFGEDKLNREPIAEMLTSLACNLSDTGAVIAIDGEWGAGKTTFVKMWKCYLESQDFKTLCFNAWKSDYIEDPLIALIGEIKDISNDIEKSKELISQCGKVILKMGKAAIKHAIEKTTGINSDIITEGIDEVSDIIQDKIDEYKSQKLAFVDFRTKLSEYVASECANKPLIFIIDELDRCNPRFAVNLLERLKHLFEVPNIIFVVAVNMEQLQYAVQGYYGSSNLNGRGYLERFFDLIFRLPAPDFEKYVEYLFEKYDFTSYFTTPNWSYSQMLNDKAEIFRNLAINITTSSNLDLRTTNKLFSFFRLAINCFEKESRIPIDMIFLLCYLKNLKPQIYHSISESKYSIQQLIDVLECELPSPIFSSNNFDFSDSNIANAVAHLLLAYNYPKRGIPLDPEFKYSNSKDGKMVFPLKCKHFNFEMLNEALIRYQSADSFHQYGLSPILNRISLLEAFKRY